MNWMRRNVGVCTLLMFLMTLMLGCDQGTPEKKIASPFMMMQSLSGTTSDGQKYGLEDCEQGTGAGSLEGVMVDPYEYVDLEELGFGQAHFEFCDEWLELSGQSISTVIEDPEYGNFFVAAIGDFYATEGPFVLIQAEASLLTQGRLEIDGQNAAVFLLDGNFEQVIAYATSGVIVFGQVGTGIGDPVSLEFEGAFEKMSEPQPQGNALADFEVVVEEVYMDESDVFVPSEMGIGRFTVELEDAWYQGGPDASAYRYDYCWDDDYPEGDRCPTEDEYVPACEAYLQITIGDLAGWIGEFMVIEVWNLEYIEGGVRRQGFEAWAYLYDAQWNLLAMSEYAGWIETEDDFPMAYDEFAGLFTGWMVPVEDPQPCEGLAGEGRGTVDTWLNRDMDSWASYIGTGHVQVATLDGYLVEIGDLARAAVYGGEIYDEQGGESPPHDDWQAEDMLYLEIGDLTFESNGLVVSLSVEFDRALEGGEISIGEYGEAYVYVYDLYSYQTLGHGVQGSLSFNQIGGQDGDLVIGHFDVVLEADCDEPQPPECLELSAEVTSQVVAPVNADLETPVTVTVGYIDPIFWPDEPVTVEAMAYVYSNYWMDGEDGPVPPEFKDVYISLYITEGQGEPLDYADAWMFIPAEYYLEGQTVYFELNNEEGLYPVANYYASAMGMSAWGDLAGSIQIVDDGLEPGEQAELHVRFDAASACFDEWEP